MLVRTALADDMPSGSQVVSGSVSVATSGSAMTVTQGSDKAIVNWNGFSVGNGNSVNFVQPSSSSAILNRVTGDTSSTIAGSLTANGQVYLINPNGIAITPTGTVKVGGGFVASTLDISNEDFLKGQYNFNGNGASSGVSNEGIITVGRGGYAALIGGTVKNDGLIAVPMGKVGLGSGEQATLDLSGDGFLQVAVPTKDGAEGNGALIESSGTISAEGGTVVMKAATARDTARHAINLNGVVEASSVSGSDGAITFGGGDGGEVTVAGKVSTKSSTGKGGKITVTGKSVALKGATVDASGAKGGGAVKIGGDYRGSGTMQRAETVGVDASSVIRADATESGNGGSVVVWSDKFTSFAGLITALGAGTGTGGDAEVSGKALLDYAGFTNLSGPGGFGTLLLDPYNVTISTASSSGMSGFNASGNDSVLNVTTLQNALAGANVTVTTGSNGSQAGDITVNAAISWSAGTTLTLTQAATGRLFINKDISATGAGAGLVLAYGTRYALQNGARVSLSGAGSTLSIDGNAYTLIRNVTDLQAIATSGYYALATDIDASTTAGWNSGAGFAPIASGSSFTGIFAGLGHNIDGLTINRPFTSSTGLFSQTLNATLRDMTLSNVAVRGNAQVGALVGGANRSGLFNIHVTGSVTGYQEAGGIAGWIADSAMNISSSSASVTVSANGAGGLAGFSAYTVTITDSYATGSVTAATNAGGLVGQGLDGTLTLNRVYASGKVTATSGVGGLLGLMDQGPVALTDAYWDANSTGQAAAVGSLTGTGSSVSGTAVDVSGAPRTQATYSGLDFTNTWLMIDGETRPMLRNEYSTVIATPTALQLMSQDLTASYTLGANISLTSAFTADSNGYYAGLWGASGFVPIASGSIFTGTFAGFGHIIDSLTINRPFTSMTGLFSEALNATLRDMTLSNVSVTGSTRVGALVGQADNSSLSNIHVTGSVTSHQEAGGIAGWISYSTLSNVSSSASVTVSANGAGGLVSYALYAATIIDSYATGAVTAASNAGGLVGQAFGGPLTLTNVYASGRVTGASGTGGLIGVDVDSASPASFFLNNAYWDASSTAQTVAIGTASSSTITGTAVDVSGAPRTQATYSGLDFTNTWVMIEGETRPMLRNEYSTVIATPAALQLMSQDLGASYTLGANIDLTGAFTANSNGSYAGLWGASGFVPIGSNSSGFTGSFDGQGHTITGLTISRASANYIGLFGNNSGGSIRDIGLIGASIRGYSHVGGLVGSNDNGTISTAYTTGDVYGVYNAGGLIGNSYNSTTSDAYSTAVVYGRNQGGGLIGLSDNSTISNSYATGAVSGVTAVGGLVGYSSQSAISNVFATGAVSGSSYYIGGLVGWNNGTISEAYATGDVSGGGITVGGLVGLNNNGTISNTYAAGAVSGSATLGGLVGTNNNGGTVIGSFFDSQKSGQSMGVGIGDGSGVTGLTTAQMASLSTFTGAGWDIDDTGGTGKVWRIYDGYTAPLLRSFMPGLTVTGATSTKTYDGLATSTNVGTLAYSPTSYNSALVLGTAGYTASSANAGSYSGAALRLGGLYSTQLGYDLTLNAGSMTINKAALTVTANNASKVYDSVAYSGGNGVAYSGFVNGETASAFGGSLAWGGTSQGASVAGSYGITASGLTSGNYDITYAPGTLTISPANVNLTITPGTASKTYGQTLVLNSYSVSGSLIGSDAIGSVSLASAGTAASAGAGTYDITASNAVFSSGSASNYAITYQVFANGLT
ncbi:GLUG motif-containing protein, partial [Rhizobium sp. FY34]|uniref:beta strand repeat-containing protein n=1 Tax=Rhizobium sp. FY34 TaxID=2562309 RepID=UPI00197E4B74